jgi:hypothetical protein
MAVRDRRLMLKIEPGFGIRTPSILAEWHFAEPPSFGIFGCDFPSYLIKT